MNLTHPCSSVAYVLSGVLLPLKTETQVLKYELAPNGASNLLASAHKSQKFECSCARCNSVLEVKQ